MEREGLAAFISTALRSTLRYQELPTHSYQVDDERHARILRGGTEKFNLILVIIAERHYELA